MCDSLSVNLQERSIASLLIDDSDKVVINLSMAPHAAIISIYLSYSPVHLSNSSDWEGLHLYTVHPKCYLCTQHLGMIVLYLFIFWCKL